MTQEALKLEREMKQLREVYAVQERDGSWEINDYLLGMLNGLELALSIMENRPPQYKIRKALAQPEQEPVKMVAYNCTCGRTMKFESVHGVVAPQRTWVGLTVNEIALINADYPLPQGFAKSIEAKLKQKNGYAEEKNT